jgi:hypothetical protein
MGRASNADAPIAGILGRVTELPRYIGRHSSADDAEPPGDSATADGCDDAEGSTSAEPPDEESEPETDAGASSMPKRWQGSQGPPARQRPWPGPSVGQAPPFPPRPQSASFDPETSLAPADPFSAGPFSADSERANSFSAEPDTAELAEPDSAEPEQAEPEQAESEHAESEQAESEQPDSFSADLDQVPIPSAAVRPEPMPAPDPMPAPEPKPEPEPEPDEALETAPRVHLSMAPRPRSELPSDERPGSDPESEPEPPERTAVPYRQALPETEAEPEVYSLPEQSYPGEPPPPEKGFPERAAEEPEVDTHGLARLALMHAIKTVWPGGTPDLTTWLAENLDLLEDPLGFALSPHHQMAWVPTRSAVRGLGGDIAPLDIPGNLVTADMSGAAVLVRAQVDDADTDGLGALLSAAAVAQAQTAVWVCPRIDEDLRQTLRWIGGDPAANVRLYGLEMYLVRIGGSPTAPLFDAVVSPGGSS